MLCYLEGKTHQEAAQHVGCPGATAPSAPAPVQGTAQAALAKRTANWRSAIKGNVFAPGEQDDRKRAQRSMFE